MSVIWPLGDALPPTAIIGRLTKDTVGMEESYGRMLVYCLVPAVLIIVTGTLMVVFSKELSFLTLL
jgi:CitMHS family citrate-Mg2+:H+ or citrate-Ca2+:H+ symporter